MHTCSRHLLATSFAALLATLGASAAHAKLSANGIQTNGIWTKVILNGVQTNGHQAADAPVKAPISGTPVTPRATTVTLPNGTTLSVR